MRTLQERSPLAFTPHLDHAARRQASRSERLRIFIVEDSALILENLIETLEETGPVTVVGSANDESTAVQRLIQSKGAMVQLVIVDLFLKSGSGLGVLRALRQTGSPVRRIVLTNYASPDIRSTCLQLGADRVFDKSAELDELIAYCARLGALSGGEPGPQGARDH
ncbi:MAG: response regulator [Rubrivivax sp.]